jgi:hypothetical protein
MMNPASSSTAPGTALMVAAMMRTMTMKKKKKTAVAARNGNSKFPISNICPQMTARMKMAMAAMVIAATARTKIVATRTVKTMRERMMVIATTTRTPLWVSKWCIGPLWDYAIITLLVRMMAASITDAMVEGRRDGLRGRSG